MRKIWRPILVSVGCLWGLSFNVNLWGSTEEEQPCSRIVEAKTFEELEVYFSRLSPTDALGWDCDNTWVALLYPDLPDFLDFESCRELKHLWTEAGKAAASEGLYRGDPEMFGEHCHDLLRRKDLKDEYVLFEPRMLQIHQNARSIGCDSFVCTGLSPDDEKVNFLKYKGFDLSNDYKSTDHVNSLFATYLFSTFGGWLYAPDNKAHSMMKFLECRNQDRQSMLKPALTRLLYVDNDLGTLKRIDAHFKMIGIELVLIHWRAHALAMEEKHRLGQLVPKILEGYRTLIKPTQPQMGFGSILRSSQPSNGVSSTLLVSSGFVGLSLCADYDSEDEYTPLSTLQGGVLNASPPYEESFDTGSAHHSGEEGLYALAPKKPVHEQKSDLRKSGDALEFSNASK